MKCFFAALTGGAVLLGASASYADDTSTVMCEQFEIDGATRNVLTTSRLDADFVPPHHAPRNIPIAVSVPEGAPNYIHFPIVENGTYLIYTTEPDRFSGLKQKDGTAIATTPLGAAEACSAVLTGGFKAEINLGQINGPTPIAIEFKEGAAETLKLIVSRDPINS